MCWVRSKIKSTFHLLVIFCPVRKYNFSLDNFFNIPPILDVLGEYHILIKDGILLS